MWSSERRRLLRGLGAALALAGFGGGLAGCFRPMLAEDGPSAALLGRVALPEVSDRFSYHLNRSLAQRLGEPREPEYRLEVATRLEREQLAITRDDAVTRISLTAVADWALYGREADPGAAGALLKGRTVSQSGYNSTASIFATREIRRDVERRMARDLGERIARRLLAQAGGIGGAAGS